VASILDQRLLIEESTATVDDGGSINTVFAGDRKPGLAAEGALAKAECPTDLLAIAVRFVNREHAIGATQHAFGSGSNAPYFGKFWRAEWREFASGCGPNSKGEQTAWVADYRDQEAKRRIKTFKRKKTPTTGS
jgi:hypothetical protein